MRWSKHSDFADSTHRSDGEPEASLDVCEKDTILSGEVLIALQQLLVDRS